MEAVEPHWSPDGKRIAFMAQNANGVQRIYTVSAEGGTPAEVLPAWPKPEGVPTWSADGESIVFGDLMGDPHSAISTMR